MLRCSQKVTQPRIFSRHSYGHDYASKPDQKRLHGPVYQDSRHSYGHDPARPTPEKQSAFPVMNAPHSHQVCAYFAFQLEVPILVNRYQRDFKSLWGSIGTKTVKRTAQL